MRCPHCGSMDDKVIDSRTLANGESIRRRRECVSCGFRFTSYERIEEKPLMVVKRDGRREPFERQKLERGVVRAVQDNPASDLLVLDSGALVPLTFVVGGPSDGVVHVEVPDGLFELYEG